MRYFVTILHTSHQGTIILLLDIRLDTASSQHLESYVITVKLNHIKLITINSINLCSTFPNLSLINIVSTERLSNTQIIVSDAMEETPNSSNICNEILNGEQSLLLVTCDYKNRNPPSLRGRYVTILRAPHAQLRYLLNFCEVSVLSCPPGMWGYNSESSEDCAYACERCRNISETCGVSDGYCYTGCQDGFWRTECDKECDCSDGDSCDRLTGCAANGKSMFHEKGGGEICKVSKQVILMRRIMSLKKSFVLVIVLLSSVC